MSVIQRLRRRLAAERGYTLIELLIGISMGLVISFAAFGLVEVSLRLAFQINDRADASDSANTVLQSIDAELESACTGTTVLASGSSTPIQGPIAVTGLATTPGSGNTELTFTNAPGSAVTPVPVLHDIVYSGTAHTLTDTAYPATTTVGPFAFTATAATSTTAANVYPVGTAAIFTYFAYNTNGALPTGFDLTGASAPLVAPLTVASAQTVIEVAIDFEMLPHDARTTSYGTSATSGSTPIATADGVVVLRLTPFTAANPTECS